MSGSALRVESLSKSFDGVLALENFSCSVFRGEILGLIGPNGAGKTTVFNVVSGFMDCKGGKVLYGEREITGAAPYRIARLGICRTFQDLRLIRQISVLDNILLAFPEQPGEKLRDVFLHWRRCSKQERLNQAEGMALLARMGLTEKAYDRAENLSYGQQKLLSLACCLASRATVLLLDEPFAGIAPEMIERILEIIRKLPGEGKSVVLIEHNLDAVREVCDRVIFMESGAKISEGTPEEVRNAPRVIEAYLG